MARLAINSRSTVFLGSLLFVCAVTVLADYAAGLRAFENKDYASALREWRSSAEQGDAQSQNALGFLYEHGLGAPASAAGAVKWYRSAAEQGYGPAEYNLGLMYRKGSGVSSSRDEAVRWLEKAAAHGIAAAQLDLGNISYDNGNGSAQQAMKWWEMAARNGVSAAAYNLAFLYAHGRGVSEDDAAAFHWYQVAGEQGYAPAELALGVMLKDGRGAAKDPVQARMWLELARRSGVAGAEAQIQELDRALPPSDVQRAIAMASQRKPAAQSTQPGQPAPGGGRVLISDFGPLSAAPTVPQTPPAVRKVSDPGPQVKWPGRAATGFFVDANGDVLTDASVVRGCRSLLVRTPASEAPAQIISADSASPLAVVRSSERGAPLAISDQETASAAIRNIGYEIQGTTAQRTETQGESPDTGGPAVDSEGRVAGFHLSRVDGASAPGGRASEIRAPEIRRFLAARGIGAVESNMQPGKPSDSVVLVECKQ